MSIDIIDTLRVYNIYGMSESGQLEKTKDCNVHVAAYAMNCT